MVLIVTNGPLYLFPHTFHRLIDFHPNVPSAIAAAASPPPPPLPPSVIPPIFPSFLHPAFIPSSHPCFSSLHSCAEKDRKSNHFLGKWSDWSSKTEARRKLSSDILDIEEIEEKEEGNWNVANDLPRLTAAAVIPSSWHLHWPLTHVSSSPYFLSFFISKIPTRDELQRGTVEDSFYFLALKGGQLFSANSTRNICFSLFLFLSIFCSPFNSNRNINYISIAATNNNISRKNDVTYHFLIFFQTERLPFSILGNKNVGMFPFPTTKCFFPFPRHGSLLLLQ